jgi:chorismate mutase
VRGATIVPPEQAAWPGAVIELLRGMVECNRIDTADIAAAVFTLPAQLAELRAAAIARRFGWTAVPLMEVAQVERAGDPPRCLRVLLLWNTDRCQDELRHVYLGAAAALRPDLVAASRPDSAGPGQGEGARR